MAGNHVFWGQVVQHGEGAHFVESLVCVIKNSLGNIIKAV